MPEEIDDMSVSDFYEFMFFEQMEPFGDRRADLLAGIISANIANVHRDPKTKRDAYTPQDFMVPWDPKPVVRQTPEQSMLMMLALQAAQNAQVKQMEEQNG